MKKITDKRFLKYIDLTKNDMMTSAKIEFKEELENISKTKKLTVWNIQTLFPFLLHRVSNPDHYTKELKAALASGKDFAESLEVIAELEKEHIYMYEFINRFYSIEELLPDFYMVVPHNISGEVA